MTSGCKVVNLLISARSILRRRVNMSLLDRLHREFLHTLAFRVEVVATMTSQPSYF